VDSGSARPSGHESWKRLWVRRDGRSRVEHRTPGVEAPFLTEIHDPDGISTIASDGTARRGDAPMFPTVPTWLLDPGSLLGLLRLSFGADDEFAGRPVVHAAATMRRELPPMAFSAGPMLYGMPIGGRSELTIDVETGILVRFATFEGPRLVGMRQFLDLTVDQPVEDELVTFRLPPGSRFRTHRDDMLDVLRAEGEDVEGIDPDDEEAVQRAIQARHERHRGSFFGGRIGRSLPELVAPLGPGPEDPQAAREAIQDALDALADDHRPKADGVERGELLDADARRGRGPTPHPMLGDQTVTFVLGAVAFVRDDEALVEFDIRMSGGGAFPVKGRAVRRGGRWLLSYETWAGLQQMGGYQVPSLLEHPEDPDGGP
jgi:hypothetical protein